MKIELTLANPRDLDSLLPLVAAYHAFEGLDSTREQRAAAVARLLADASLGGIWLIRADDSLAGYIALCRGFSIEFNGFDAFVDELYLEPGFRGRGIGSFVLTEIRSEARRQGIRALHLEVARGNARAQKLYRSAGFTARDKYLLMSAALDDCPQP